MTEAPPPRDWTDDAGGRAHPTRSPASWAIQTGGFLLGLSLLAGCAWIAVQRPEYRDQLRKLADAPAWQSGALLGLSGLTVALSGLVFRAVLAPIHRLRAVDVVAVNSVCSALSYIPFKASLIFRVAYHHRRDRLALAQIGAWLAATAAVIVASLAPSIAASMWRRAVDAWWWTASVGGTVALTTAMIVSARILAGDRAWALLVGMLQRTGLEVLGRVARSAWLHHLHGGTRMLASLTAVVHAMALRTVDLSAQAARFYLAAHVVGTPMSAEQALLAGALYFALQATAPTGVGGVREAGTAAALGAYGLPDMLVVVLVVSASEATMNLVMGALGALWLRAGRRPPRATGTGGQGARSS